MSRALLGLLLFAACSGGCHRFTLQTRSRVAFDNPVQAQIAMETPVEARVTADIPPVNPNAGAVRAILVRTGENSARVAVVDVDGLILNTPFVGFSSLGENPVSLFREKLDAVEADGNVKAVVLRVNSPGGGVAACIAMRRDLDRFKARTRLPVVACLLDTATGGAYLLASAADQIVANPATVTGGIGVVLNLYNLRDLMGQFNIVAQGIKAGPKVDIGSSARNLTDEEEKLLQAMADEFHAQLKADILRSRPGIDAAGGTTFDGRIFTASQALRRKLIDRIGDIDDTIDLAAGLAGCPVRAEAVLYRRANDPAFTPYAVTPNVPLQGAGLLPSMPGLDRSKLPTFLSLWQPELTTEKLSGK